MECLGIDPYNIAATGNIVSTVTTYVGQSTASGPKVIIKKKCLAIDMGGGKSASNITQDLSPTITCTHGGEPVVGTIDASIYKKNGFQDNTKYLIEKKKRRKTMGNSKAINYLKQLIGEKQKDAISIIELSESLLHIVADGVMTVKEAIDSLKYIRESIENKKSNCTDTSSEKGIEDDNIMNQQFESIQKPIKCFDVDDTIRPKNNNSQNEDNRSLASSTHDSDMLLAKTEAEVTNEEEEEFCIVRRLTPTETSRLQGFPDDYTKIDGEETADAPQFKAHGNSWATPCANFVSTRIEMELRRLGHVGTIRYATCCSGIEAQSVAVRNLNWKSVFFSEIEPFPCRVLATHYPETPNLGDMTQIHYDVEKGCITNSHNEGEEYSLPKEFKEAPIQELPFNVGDLEVFSGGTPCQSISIAGKREGMAEGSGTRSSLAFHYQRIIDESRPMFTLWENVPGAFSSNGGADFIWFVNRCAESGYAMAWRVLDAQYTMTEEFPRAVPQRRRRIWLVGYRGNDWRVPARIVFELEKDLTANPPARVPGLGFKELSEDGRKMIESGGESTMSTAVESNQLGLAMESDDGRKELLKVSRLIDFSEMPEETDFSRVSMADIFAFAKKIGEPGYIGSVFRTDKKKKAKKVDDSFDLFSMMNGNVPKEEVKKEPEKDDNEEWEGAEKITPAILENIGNAGILANGRICTMNCHEWTSGIQLSPMTYNAWEEVVKYKDWLKANDLLPEAYDETVCGLSDVLQDDPDEKYNLSWRACFGILRRAEARGKELPPALEIALICTIRDNAGIVKWVALNGKDTKKKETDLTERESAMLCFKKFISSVIKFEDVVAIQPNKKNDEEEIEDQEDEENEVEVDEDGNLILREEEFGLKNMPNAQKPIKKDSMPELPNGVVNASGGETASTLVTSGDAAVGTTQDANVIALKK